MPPTMMTITLYDKDSEPVKTFNRGFVPWKLLKKAVRLSKSIDVDDLGEESLDELAGLVVETFGNQFTIDDLNEGADISEMITVLQTVISKARNAMGNPIKPGS